MSLADLRHCAEFEITALTDLPGQKVIEGLDAEASALVENESEEDLEAA
jgi:hypothetical protein